jgi:hypothetical protein
VGHPRRAGFPLWTGSTLSLPIDGEVTHVVGLRLLRLPGDIRAHRAKELKTEVVRTLHQQLSIDIARLDDMRLWGELPRRQGVVNRARSWSHL